jgi:hypothetical protein
MPKPFCSRRPSRPFTSQAMLLLLLLACGVGPARSSDTPAMPSAAPQAAAPDAGSSSADAIVAHRLQPGERIRLDGRLAHPAWQRAPAYRQFVQKSPDTGAAASRETEVRVLFDEHALYVGIDAREPQPERIRAPWVRHDQVNRTQDFVVVYVDAIGARQSAQFFRVSASGGTADGMHTAADDSEDFAPDFDFDAAAHRHAQGYSVVLRIPFASLRYAGDSAAGWRMMVGRRTPREQFFMDSSVLIPREAPSFIATLQPLQGVELPAQHQFLALRPSLTWRASRERKADGSSRSGTGWDATLDLKWRPRAEWVIDATLNPDFSQVALDVPQLSGNERFALSFPEKRPFFFESSDLLRTPSEAIYTRSFTEPRWGLRSTWRGRGLAGSLFAVDDRGGGLVLLPGAYGTGAARQPGSMSLAGRLSGQATALQWGTLVATRRYEDERGRNDVLGPDLAWQIDDAWRLRAQWLRSDTTAHASPGAELKRGAVRSGWQAVVRANRLTDRSEVRLDLTESSPGFRHDTGFVTQVGTRDQALHIGRGWFPQSPVSEFWLTLDARHARERASGVRVSQEVYPGFWLGGAHNLEWWLQWHGNSTLRTAATAPLLRQRYWKSEFTITPAEWIPFLTLGGRQGQLADAYADTVRDGHEAYLVWTTRPHPRLEFEPRYSVLELRSDGQRHLRETVGQVLAVWHFNAAQTLRAIVQRTTLERGAANGLPQQQDAQTQASLTYAWRRSAGTVLYAGWSRSREGAVTSTRGSELFVKLQVDVEEARTWLGR